MIGGMGRPPSGRRVGAKRVVRTGLALVHENEVVYPSAGSRAVAELAVDDASADIELHFPVVIEIIDSAAEARAAGVAESVSREAQERLARALRPR